MEHTELLLAVDVPDLEIDGNVAFWLMDISCPLLTVMGAIVYNTDSVN